MKQRSMILLLCGAGALGVLGCNTHDAPARPRPPMVASPAAPPPAATASAPSEDEVMTFMEAWYPELNRGDRASGRFIMSNAVIDLNGCTDYGKCLPAMGGFTGTLQAMGDVEVHAAGDHAILTVRVDDLYVGSMEIEMHRALQPGTMAVDRIQATWTRGRGTIDE
jgi:hypothetical protein